MRKSLAPDTIPETPPVVLSFFFNLGGMPKGIDPSKAAPHHTPDFYIDDSMLDVGVKAFCNLVFDYAAKKK